MDDFQKNLVIMVNEQPSCIKDRKQLKAVLMDYLPQNKLQQNLLLNAYDEGIIERLTSSADATLRALQMVKTLSDSYGLTKDSAVWAVTTWCYALGLVEIANTIEETTAHSSTPSSTSHQQPPQVAAKLPLGHGMYLAGVDFPSGNIKLEASRDHNTKDIYYAIIKKGSNSILINGFFETQMYLSITDGQRLEVRDNVLLSSV